MTVQRIGITHPGAMGISIAASAQRSGHDVCWASDGRSAATVERAMKHGLRDTGRLDRLCAECSVLISVCPPHAAEAVARQVAGNLFRGLYVDANAISPRPQMGAEDFAYFAEAVPSFYLLLGVRNEAKGITAMIHTPEFDVDEECLPIGVNVMANVVLDYLEKKVSG